MALYRWNTKVSWIWQSFNPENIGTEWQVLTKTNSWYAYCDVPEELPTTWNVWDVLTKTADWVAFSAPQGWWSKMVDVLLMWAWGWWGWWWCTNVINDWWGWWAWELKIVNWYVVNSDSISVTVWAWGTWWNTWRPWVPWWNWCPTKFWDLSAMWGWWGWGWHNSNYMDCWIWKDWANWWWAWGWYIGVWQCMWRPFNCGHYWAWPSCTNNNWNWWGWWGGIWGNAWFEGRPFCSTSWNCKYFYWWPWKFVCFWGTVRCIWWWWHWWSALYNTAPSNYVCWQNSLLARLQWTCFWWWCWWAISPINWCNWTANTWWWGWGWGSSTAWGWNWGNWGSWLAIVRYPTDWSYWITSSTWWNTCRTCTIDWVEYCIHEFTSDWTFTITW